MCLVGLYIHCTHIPGLHLRVHDCVGGGLASFFPFSAVLQICFRILSFFSPSFVRVCICIVTVATLCFAFLSTIIFNCFSQRPSCIFGRYPVLLPFFHFSFCFLSISRISLGLTFIAMDFHCFFLLFHSPFKRSVVNAKPYTLTARTDRCRGSDQGSYVS